MTMRSQFSVLFLILTIALIICAFLAFNSKKPLGKSVGLLLATLVPPLVGNIIIVNARNLLSAQIGSYVYFLGMDIVMFGLLNFTFDYCQLKWPNRRVKWFVYSLLIIDVIQLLLNPVFHHAFANEIIQFEGAEYYRLVPYIGQQFHRIVDYGIFFAVLIIFFVKMVRSVRIYSERYWIILISMVFTGIWETFYIFSRTPIDRSMIGFAVFGLLVYYFALYYRPLRLLDRMLASIAQQMPEALFFFDSFGQCIWANEPAVRLVGISPSAFYEATPRINALFGDLKGKDAEFTENRVIGQGDDARYYVLERHIVNDDKGKPAGSFLSIRDNTEEQIELRREQYTAWHDELTHLYSKSHLYEEIRSRLENEPDTDFYLLYIDVSDFKLINDIFGHVFGDRVLCQIADWIREEFAEYSVYGRIGGDTFGVLLPWDRLENGRIESVLSNFVVSDGTVSHMVVIHIGVYEIAERELDVSVMVDRARMAQTTIKNDYHNHIAYYDEEMREKSIWNQHISAELHDALRNRDICPYLQPLVDENGKVVGAEALVRWIHPTDGFLSPASFIPVFENNGMIAEVDRYMWRCACEILSEWKKNGIEDCFISVNISPKDFYFMDVTEEITKIVREFEINPRQLRLEITETVVMADIEKRIEIMSALHQAGFIVEMDDFGSGYSSLNMLKDMPVDVIKIDMMFLKSSAEDARARTILRNIIHLTEEVGIVSLTEGVETEDQFHMLFEMGCRMFQGYYFAKPMPVRDFETTFLHLQTGIR